MILPQKGFFTFAHRIFLAISAIRDLRVISEFYCTRLSLPQCSLKACVVTTAQSGRFFSSGMVCFSLMTKGNVESNKLSQLRPCKHQVGPNPTRELGVETWVDWSCQSCCSSQKQLRSYECVVGDASHNENTYRVSS